MSQADNYTLVETVPIGRNMDHHKTLISICGQKKRRCVRLRMVLRGRLIAKEKVAVFHEASLGIGLLNDGQHSLGGQNMTGGGLVSREG